MCLSKSPYSLLPFLLQFNLNSKTFIVHQQENLALAYKQERCKTQLVTTVCSAGNTVGTAGSHIIWLNYKYI